MRQYWYAGTPLVLHMSRPNLGGNLVPEQVIVEISSELTLRWWLRHHVDLVFTSVGYEVRLCSLGKKILACFLWRPCRPRVIWPRYEQQWRVGTTRREIRETEHPFFQDHSSYCTHTLYSLCQRRIRRSETSLSSFYY